MGTSMSSAYDVVSVLFDDEERLLVGQGVFVFRRSPLINQSVMPVQSNCQIVEQFCSA